MLCCFSYPNKLGQLQKPGRSGLSHAVDIWLHTHTQERPNKYQKIEGLSLNAVMLTLVV